MAKKKKVNPRRIPLAKSALNKDAIISEATEDDMYRAWLLVANALLEQERVEPVEIQGLADTVNKYVAASSSVSERKREQEMKRAEEFLGIPADAMILRANNVKSPIQLDKFKAKVFKLATYTSLCVIYLGLEKYGRFSSSDLKNIFFNVDITLADIESGRSSYKELENLLASQMISIEVENGEYSTVKVTE